MIRSNTVFVIGAGASKELGFPLGEELLTEIAAALDFGPDPFGNLERGDRLIWESINEHIEGDALRLNAFHQAARQVREAAHLGRSIDNVIHQQNHDEAFVLCAKLGIARRILDAEDRSCLKLHGNNRTVTWPEVRGTWLHGFAQLVVQDVERTRIDDIFANVSVISFNYDRTIRRFLPLALQSQFALPPAEAETLAAQLPILHPYGSLGALGYDGADRVVPYGAPRPGLLAVASNLRTFTEQVTDEGELVVMRRLLENADRIVFLGFGYLSQNMSLLLDHVSGSARQVLGTSYGMSFPDREEVVRQLGSLIEDYRRGHTDPRLSDLKCAEFIQENFRSITA